MQTFAVISVNPNPALDRAVQTIYAGAHQAVAPNVWLVSDDQVTTGEVSAKLGVKRGEVDGLVDIVILKFDAYWGHASKSIWTWIDEKRATT